MPLPDVDVDFDVDVENLPPLFCPYNAFIIEVIVCWPSCLLFDSSSHAPGLDEEK